MTPIFPFHSRPADWQALRAMLLAHGERDTLAMIEVEKALSGGAPEATPA